MFQIAGSKSVTVQEHVVSSFIKLHVIIHGTVEIVQLDEEKVVVECDDNLQEYVEVVNSGRTLYVMLESGIRKPLFSKIKVTVYVRQIDTLVNSGHGEVTCINQIVSTEPFYLEVNAHGNTHLNIKTPSLKALCRSHGNVTLEGECGEANIKTQMHGHLFAKGLKAATLNLKNMSHGNMEVFANDQITIKHMGHGHVHYYGTAVLKDVNMMGHGAISHMKE